MRNFVNLHHQFGWDKKQKIPSALQAEVREKKEVLLNWEGRQFQHRATIRRLQSDASQTGWAGVDLTENRQIQEFWRDQQGLHINIKELHAAIQTVKSLAKPKEQVNLSVDNTVAYSYLKKGGAGFPASIS